MNASPARGDLEGGRRCALVRRHQGRRARRRGGGVLRSRARRRHAGAAQARRPSRLQAPLRRRADRGLSRRRPAGSRWRATPTPWPTGSPPGLPPRASPRSGRSRPTRCSSPLPARIDARLKAAGASYYPWTTRCAAERYGVAARRYAGAPGHVVRHHRGRGRSFCDNGRALLDDVRVPVPKERPIPAIVQSGAPFTAIDARDREPRSGSRVLKQKIALCAGVLALSLTASASASAQPAPSPLLSRRPADPGAAALPPHESRRHRALDRARAVEPPDAPGPTYVAARGRSAPAGKFGSIVDARLGRILKVVPVLLPRYAALPPPPPAYGRPAGRIAAVPDGYGPNSRIATLPPGRRRTAAGWSRAGPPPRSPAARGSPPLPRRAPAGASRPAAAAAAARRKLAAAEPTAAPPVTSAAPPGRAAARRGQGHEHGSPSGSEATSAAAPSRSRHLRRRSRSTSDARKMKAPRNTGALP